MGSLETVLDVKTLRVSLMLTLLSSVSLSACAEQVETPKVDSHSVQVHEQQAKARADILAQDEALVAAANVVTKEVTPMVPAPELKPQMPDAAPRTLNSVLSSENLSAFLANELASTDNRKDLILDFIVSNPQAHSVQIQFNSGMTADLLLIDPQGEVLWTWSNDMMFTQALRTVSLASGAEINTHFSVPMTLLKSIKGTGYRFRAVFKGKRLDDSADELVAPAELTFTVK